VHIKCL